MHILYDFQGFFPNKFDGVSRCFVELIAHLPPEAQYTIAIKESNNMYLQSASLVNDLRPIRSSLGFLENYKFRGKGTLRRLLDHNPLFSTSQKVNMNATVELLRKGEFDVFHATNNFSDYYIPYLGKKPLVITVHDMIWEIFPNNAQPKNCKMQLIKQATHIVAVSEKTKEDLVRISGIPEEKVTVIYHGGPEVRTSFEPRLVKEPYILYVGRRGNYKKFNEFLRESAPFLYMHPEFSILCTGHGLNAEQTRLVESLNLTGRVKTLFASDSELYNLYHYAFAFVYPSCYEGFGIPILEAYACQCPVILNHASCFPEIAGDAALFFSFDDKGKISLSQAYETLFGQGEAGREALIRKGNARLKYFSWQRSADKLYALYQSLL